MIFLGLHIFHSQQGSIPLIGIGPYLGKNIGEYLGQIVEIKGHNRVYYLNKDGDRKYVSIKGIGLVCTSLEEVDKLNHIRDSALFKFKNAINEIGNFIETSIKELQ